MSADIEAIRARLAASRAAHEALQKRVAEPWIDGRQPTYGELWAVAMNAYQAVLDNAFTDLTALLAENERLKARLVLTEAAVAEAMRYRSHPDADDFLLAALDAAEEAK